MKALAGTIILFFILPANLNAQKDGLVAQADLHYKIGAYGQALRRYEDLLKKEPGNPLLNFKAGVCYLHSRSQKTKAVTYLEKSVNGSPGMVRGEMRENEAPVTAFKYLGDAYRHAFKFDDAIRAYEKFIELCSHTP